MTEPFPTPSDPAALDWAIRVRDPDFDDWDGFSAWLEAHPDHAAAYDAACDADDAVAGLFATPPAPRIQPTPAPPRAARMSRRWVAGGGAVAAAVALAFVYNGMEGRIGGGGAPYSIQTAPGVTRSIELAGGSRIVLNGDSRVTLDDAAPRAARLDRGEALFVVAHDARNPFIVDVGRARLVDLGTVFNVAFDDESTRVAVSEGIVLYNPDAQAVRLDAGRALEERGGRITVRPVAPDAVGGWQRGSLSFDSAPLSQVAADLSRTLGTRIRPDAAVAQRRFTGTIAADGDAETVLPAIAPLLGVDARARSDGWILTSPTRATP